jgi:hypothetical protein
MAARHLHLTALFFIMRQQARYSSWRLQLK